MSALLHMLGLDADHREPWRNHYVTGPEDEPELVDLVARGLVEEVDSPGFLARGDRTFRATEAGRALALAENARRNPPPRTSKRRYLHWLRLSDVLPDLSFGEYLRRKLYNDPTYGAP